MTRDVDDQEHDRDGHGEGGERIAIGIAFPARDGGNEEHESRERKEPEREEAREAVELAPSARDQRCTENEKQVPDDAARERPAHDFRQPLVDGDEGDDQLGRVAEGGVQEASDPGSRVDGRVLGRLADDPGERDEGNRRDDELQRGRDVGEVVKPDRDGCDGEGCEEDAADHRGENPRRALDLGPAFLALRRRALAGGTSRFPQTPSPGPLRGQALLALA